MSVLYLQFENGDRNTRVQKLGKSGAHIVPVEPRWPIFFELAKREKPYAIAIDFSQAPTHCLETADYIAKAKETRETPLYLLRVPDDRRDAVRKRLPNAGIVTEQDLAGILVVEEKKAQERAREKKEAAAAARKTARAKKLGLDKPPPPPPPPAVAAGKGKPAPRPKGAPPMSADPRRKASSAPSKKKPAPARKATAPRPAKKK